jgi:type I restriction enzyme S subunit
MTVNVAALVSDHLDVWTAATERKSGAGRGAGRKINHYGIERLRALILDLAVRGKLVSQDARDEPATDLLKSIKADRAKLKRSKSIGKGKAFPTVSPEPPFAIPENWIWVQISDIGHDWGQTVPQSNFTYIDVGSIDQGLGAVQSPSVMSASDAPSRARKIVRQGTVIYSTVRPYLLNIAIIDREFDPQPIASTAFAVIHPFQGVEAGYVFRYLRSPAFVRYVESCQTGIAYPAINDRQFFAAWCPLPPFAEQRRIVAKVDELLALCDALEAKSAAAMADHQALVETLLTTLTASTDAAELTVNWARLEAHFDTLFTTEGSIDALKRAILELAVRGTLVEQDPKEEPASELLKRIRESIKRSVVSGQSKKGRYENNGGPAKHPFPIPPNWAWIHLSEISTKITDGAHHTPQYLSEGIPFLSVKDMSSGILDFSDSRFISPNEHAVLFERCNPEIGDLLITKVGTTGVPVIVDTVVPFSLFVSVALVKAPWDLISVEFLRLLIDSPFVRRQSAEGTQGIGNKNLVLRTIASFSLPFPPLAEQVRIVSKVTELTAVCDMLKSNILIAAQTQRHLADTIVERAVA